MARPRDTRKDNYLPRFVYRVPSRNRVIWREHHGKGKFGKQIMLTDEQGRPLAADAPHRAITAAYSRQITSNSTRTLHALMSDYIKAPKPRPLAARTLADYRRYVDAIANKPLHGGSLFGDADIRRISPGVIARYRDSLPDKKVTANRHLQFLSVVFSWAVEREYVERNPCKGVRLFSVQPRTRYVEDWEFDLVQGMAPDYVAVAMELAYLMRARRGEVLALKREHVTEKGIFLQRSKASESEVTLWTDRLTDAHKAACAINRDVISPWILHGPSGGAIKAEAFSTAWGRLMDRAMKAGLKERFTFHDLKAKGLTDDTEHWAGHKSERMQQVYLRLAKEKKATR